MPCYAALFGPQLFGHGTRVESHKSFGQQTNVTKINSGPQMPRSQLETKLKVSSFFLINYQKKAYSYFKVIFDQHFFSY